MDVKKEQKNHKKCALLKISHKPILFNPILYYLSNRPMLFYSIVNEFPDLKEKLKNTLGNSLLNSIVYDTNKRLNSSILTFLISKFLFNDAGDKFKISTEEFEKRILSTYNYSLTSDICESFDNFMVINYKKYKNTFPFSINKIKDHYTKYKMEFIRDYLLIQNPLLLNYTSTINYNFNQFIDNDINIFIDFQTMLQNSLKNTIIYIRPIKSIFKYYYNQLNNIKSNGYNNINIYIYCIFNDFIQNKKRNLFLFKNFFYYDSITKLIFDFTEYSFNYEYIYDIFLNVINSILHLENIEEIIFKCSLQKYVLLKMFSFQSIFSHFIDGYNKSNTFFNYYKFVNLKKVIIEDFNFVNEIERNKMLEGKNKIFPTLKGYDKYIIEDFDINEPNEILNLCIKNKIHNNIIFKLNKLMPKSIKFFSFLYDTLINNKKKKSLINGIKIIDDLIQNELEYLSLFKYFFEHENIFIILEFSKYSNDIDKNLIFKEYDIKYDYNNNDLNMYILTINNNHSDISKYFNYILTRIEYNYLYFSDYEVFYTNEKHNLSFINNKTDIIKKQGIDNKYSNAYFENYSPLYIHNFIMNQQQLLELTIIDDIEDLSVYENKNIKILKINYSNKFLIDNIIKYKTNFMLSLLFPKLETLYLGCNVGEIFIFLNSLPKTLKNISLLINGENNQEFGNFIKELKNKNIIINIEYCQQKEEPEEIIQSDNINVPLKIKFNIMNKYPSLNLDSEMSHIKNPDKKTLLQNYDSYFLQPLLLIKYLENIGINVNLFNFIECTKEYIYIETILNEEYKNPENNTISDFFFKNKFKNVLLLISTNDGKYGFYFDEQIDNNNIFKGFYFINNNYYCLDAVNAYKNIFFEFNKERVTLFIKNELFFIFTDIIEGKFKSNKSPNFNEIKNYEIFTLNYNLKKFNINQIFCKKLFWSSILTNLKFKNMLYYLLNLININISSVSYVYSNKNSSFSFDYELFKNVFNMKNILLLFLLKLNNNTIPFGLLIKKKYTSDSDTVIFEKIIMVTDRSSYYYDYSNKKCKNIKLKIKLTNILIKIDPLFKIFKETLIINNNFDGFCYFGIKNNQACIIEKCEIWKLNF